MVRRECRNNADTLDTSWGLEITAVWSAGCETGNAYARFPTTLPLTNALATVQWSDVEKADERFCGSDLRAPGRHGPTPCAENRRTHEN